MLLLFFTGLTCTWDLNVNVTSRERPNEKSSLGHSIPSQERVPITGQALNKYLWNVWGLKKVCHDYYNSGTVRCLQNTLFQVLVETVRFLKEADRQWESEFSICSSYFATDFEELLIVCFPSNFDDRSHILCIIKGKIMKLKLMNTENLLIFGIGLCVWVDG